MGRDRPALHPPLLTDAIVGAAYFRYSTITLVYFASGDAPCSVGAGWALHIQLRTHR